jgi:hypothetical protein
MRSHTDRRNISVAGFLLCLLGIYAISPIDYFFRTNLGSRSRSVRTCRLDDHDHQDHALDVASLISFSFANNGGDGGDLEPVIELTDRTPPALATVGAVADYSSSSIRPAFLNVSRGRAPPSLS